MGAPPGSPGAHAPGPPMGPPMGPLFPEKNFRGLKIFPPSRPWGPHGAPDLWSICLIYIEICSFSWKIRFRHRFKRVLWLKYRLYTILVFFFNFDIFLKFCWNSLKFCESLGRYQISSISSLSSVRWISRNGRFAWYMSPKCKISSVSKVIDFIGRWILVGLVFGRFWVYLTQNCLDSVSDLKICTIFESKLIPTSCEPQYKRSHSDLFLACPNSALENHSSTANTSAVPDAPVLLARNRLDNMEICLCHCYQSATSELNKNDYRYACAENESSACRRASIGSSNCLRACTYTA